MASKRVDAKSELREPVTSTLEPLSDFPEALRNGSINLADPTIKLVRLLELYPFLNLQMPRPCGCTFLDHFTPKDLTLMWILHVSDSHVERKQDDGIEPWSKERFYEWVMGLGVPAAFAARS